MVVGFAHPNKIKSEIGSEKNKKERNNRGTASPCPSKRYSYVLEKNLIQIQRTFTKMKPTMAFLTLHPDFKSPPLVTVLHTQFLLSTNIPSLYNLLSLCSLL